MNIDSIFTEQGFTDNYTFVDEHQLTTQSIYSDVKNLFCIFEYSVDGSDELDGEPREILVIDYRFILDLATILHEHVNKSLILRNLLPQDEIYEFMIDLLQQQFIRLDTTGIWKNFDPCTSQYNSVMNVDNHNIPFYSPGEAYVAHLRFRCEWKIADKVMFTSEQVQHALVVLLSTINNSPEFKLPLKCIDTLSKNFARNCSNSEYLADICCMHIRNTEEFNMTLKGILSQ